MKNIFVSLLLISALSIYGCSSDDATNANNSAQQSVEATPEVSQAETMEEIWASALEPAEKAKRVQELLARPVNKPRVTIKVCKLNNQLSLRKIDF